MTVLGLATFVIAALSSGTLAPEAEVREPEGVASTSTDEPSAGDGTTDAGTGPSAEGDPDAGGGDDAPTEDGSDAADEASNGDEAGVADEEVEPSGETEGEAADGVEEPASADADGATEPAAGAGASGGPSPAGAGGASAPSGAGGSGGGAGADGADGALASGSVRSDDDEFYEPDPDDEGRRRRRRRRRDRSDEGQWQVFAPFPELGRIRYRDPEVRRTVWLGFDASGAYMPASLGLFDRTVWTVRPAGSWAVALAPWLALGGRHSIAWYDAQNIRTRVHAHQVELSGRPLGASRPDAALDDRLALGVSSHAIRWSEVGDLAIEPGGLDDTIVHLGYGLDHLMGTRWRLGWQAQVRYAWVYQDTQHHARLSTRLAFNPRPAHRLSAAAVGYYVNRDAQQLGNPLPRHSILGQFGLGYAWVANAGIGPWLDVRYNTSFMSGEAPVYEIREEALNADYGEVLVGMMARWQ